MSYWIEIAVDQVDEDCGKWSLLESWHSWVCASKWNAEQPNNLEQIAAHSKMCLKISIWLLVNKWHFQCHKVRLSIFWSIILWAKYRTLAVRNQYRCVLTKALLEEKTCQQIWRDWMKNFFSAKVSLWPLVTSPFSQIPPKFSLFGKHRHKLGFITT